MDFKKLILVVISLAAFVIVPESASARPGAVRLLDHEFPDPSVIKSADGWYYAYATQAKSESIPFRQINIQVARSRDLKYWEHKGDALPVKPKWARRTQNFWAPHVNYFNGKYFMYYSAEPNSTSDFCLGVAVATLPQGPFYDQGAPLKCGPGFTHIDPMAYFDPSSKRHWLYWGSGFGPIYAQELDASGLKFVSGSQPKSVLEPRPDFSYMRLIEAAWVDFHNGYYYLYYSGDSCCDPAHYAVMVARSRNPTGPFKILGDKDLNKSVILKENSQFTGPGHNSIITDHEGTLWMIYHAIDRAHLDSGTRRTLWSSRLRYINGWPRVVGQTSH